MALSPEALYLQLGQLVSEMPDLLRPPDEVVNRWLGRATALVEASGDKVNAIVLSVAAQGLSSDGFMRATNAQTIASVVNAALAKAELNAPAGRQGSFIPAGGSFDAFAAVAKVLATAKRDVLVIDPYADEKFLIDFAPTAPERVSLRILSDQATHKPSLKPVSDRWKAQLPQRPLEVRLSPARELHDRLIIIDGSSVWVVGQSFKDLAERAHSSINRVTDAETAQLKIDAYSELWTKSTPV